MGRWLAWVLPWFLAGCASFAPPDAAPGCGALYAALRDAAGAVPSYPVELPAFPGLALDRFLADAAREATDAPRRAARLARLAEQGRWLRETRLAGLPETLPPSLAPRATLDAGADAVIAALRADPARFERLRAAARIPSDYSLAQQVFGVYPLSAIPVHVGVRAYQRAVAARFAAPPVAAAGTVTYVPPASPGPVYGPLARDALGIPQPAPAQLEALFARHAPVFELATASRADLPGAPVFRADGTPDVDPHAPLVYRYASFARWGGRAVLQLNYLLWFAARPPAARVDIYAGALDGLLWRVTLDADGVPLAYDSLHSCGCYHLLFPRPGLRLRPETRDWAEPPLAPLPAPVLMPGERVIIRLSAGDHQIVGLGAGRSAGIPYRWRDYAALYRTPVEMDGARPLFGPDGLVAGSERPERWLLWPTGVISPGAMRERGRHAIAFLGERAFDDPDLLESMLVEEGGK